VKGIYKANAEIEKVYECMAKATSVLNKPEEREGFLPGETYFGISV